MYVLLSVRLHVPVTLTIPVSVPAPLHVRVLSLCLYVAWKGDTKVAERGAGADVGLEDVDDALCRIRAPQIIHVPRGLLHHLHPLHSASIGWGEGDK